MYHADLAPIGRPSESQRPATFTITDTSLRDVILTLSTAKGKDLCIPQRLVQAHATLNSERIRIRVRLQAYRNDVHTDPAPIGRDSESQRPATFTHHGTPSPRDVILTLSRAKGRDLCIPEHAAP